MHALQNMIFILTQFFLTQLHLYSLIHVNDNLMAVEQRCIVISVACFVSLVSSDRMLCTVADIQLGM